MPIYEYRCENCGHELEALQKISDDPLKLCPVCDDESLKKRVSAAAFRLKGGGWYETDFKSGNKKNLAAGEKSSSSSESKSDSKASDAPKKKESSSTKS